jgi:hypothetical protein
MGSLPIDYGTKLVGWISLGILEPKNVWGIEIGMNDAGWESEFGARINHKLATFDGEKWQNSIDQRPKFGVNLQGE